MKHKDSIEWSVLFSFVKDHRKTVISLSLVMIVVGLLDAAFPLIIRYSIDWGVAAGSRRNIILSALVYALLGLWQAVNVWFLIILAARLEMGLQHDMRIRAFRKLMTLHMDWFNTHGSGWIMSRLTSDIHKLGELAAWGLVDLVWGFTALIMVMVFMIFLNFKLALMVILVIPPLILISRFFQNRILIQYRRVRKMNSVLSTSFNENIAGVVTSKTLVREEANSRDFHSETGSMACSSIRAAQFSAIYLPVILFLSSLAASLILLRADRLMSVYGISAGTLASFISYTVLFFEPVQEMARVMADLQNARASAERISSLVSTEPGIRDSAGIEEAYGSVIDPKGVLPPMKGRVEYRDICFSYNREESVIKHFNLEIPAGSTVALVGETGSGKSTLVNLLCRFYEPDSGELLIDGREYRQEPLLWLYSHIGYVLQQPQLFRGSVRDNIRYGKLEADDRAVEEACRLTGCYERLASLPEGFDTEVGEAGVNLSLGERQLVSFARAVLADPRIFILDEATSSVDTETEKMLQHAVSVLMKGRTCLVIAHRLSTIKEADHIVVLKGGEILEQGDHSTLIEKKGHYHTLYRNQLIEEAEEEWFHTS